jgi:hypothetical protein
MTPLPVFVMPAKVSFTDRRPLTGIQLQFIKFAEVQFLNQLHETRLSLQPHPKIILRVGIIKMRIRISPPMLPYSAIERKGYGLTAHFGKWNPFFLVVVFISGIKGLGAQVDVYDDFEAPELKGIWSTGRMESRSFEIQSSIVRKGKSAARITLRTGDVAASGTGKDKPTERDELLEVDSLYSIEGKKFEYQFSMFLPDSFPIVPVRLVIAQWKQDCPGKKPCKNDSPVLALRYVSGKLFITLQTDSVRHTLNELNEEIRNRWLDFRFQVRFSRKSDGEVKAFLNGKNIVNYQGITSYPESRGYPSERNYYYFKMGLYRDRMPEPMIIYIDEYRKREIIE